MTSTFSIQFWSFSKISYFENITCQVVRNSHSGFGVRDMGIFKNLAYMYEKNMNPLGPTSSWQPFVLNFLGEFLFVNIQILKKTIAV